MAIIVSQNNQNARRIEESSFELEDNLQEYVINNPEIIPLYDVQSDARLFVAAREFATQTGPIDALGFDESGNIYIIETKMFRNADKRRVVAQALDYGASIWRHATDFEAFLAQLDTHTNKQFGASFKDQYQEFFEMEDTAESMAAIRQNLDEGNIKFVVLMDSLDNRLKDLILYVNQNSKFDIYAVDFEYYKHDQFEIVIPKLYGTEVKKTVASSAGNSNRRQWDKEAFFDVVDNNRELVSLEQKEAVHKLWNWAERRGALFSWGSGATYGTFSPVFSEQFNRSFITVSIDGYTRINYGHLDQCPGEARRLRDILKSRLGNQQPRLTDVDDNDLLRAFPAITAKDISRYADVLIQALDEFIGGAS